MNPAQNRRYWAKWNEVKKLLTTLGEFSAEDAEEQRALIQESAIGEKKSSRDLTQKQLDRVYDAFDSYMVLVTGPTDAPAISQPCKRLIWAIDQLGLDAPYIETIAFDQFKTRDWRHLNEAQLTRFRYTCTARAAALKRAKKSLP